MSAIRWLICLILVFSPVIKADEVEAAAPSSPVAEYLPGVAMSQGITEITGVAISPLLGVSAVGAWRYWTAAADDRVSLPWYAQPWAWGTGLALLALCFLKDSLGTAVPGLLKKPFDMVELFENKLSALVASSAFVPLVALEMSKHLQAEKSIVLPTAAIGEMSFAMIDLTWLMVPAAVIAFLAVWVCSHAVNVLIILSPFSTVDAVLKLMRIGILIFVALLYWIAPMLAAALCLVLVAVAAWLAPSAMRLAIFGACYAADILLPGRGRGRATPEEPHAFTLGRVSGLPPRTGGRISLLEDGTAVFRYRRCCLLDERVIPLPDAPRHLEKGLLSPSLVQRTGEAEGVKILLFLPRYRGYEETMVRHLKLLGIREHAIIRSFSAAKTWLKSLVRSKRERIAD